MSGAAEVRIALMSRLMALYPATTLYPSATFYPLGDGAQLSPASVAIENAPFTPTAGSPWYRAAFLPGIPVAAAAGSAAANRYYGVFQVDCIYPRGFGDAAAIAEAERIASHFARGTRLTHSGVVATCEKAYWMAGYVDPEKPWFVVPVRVQWRADIGP